MKISWRNLWNGKRQGFFELNRQFDSKQKRLYQKQIKRKIEINSVPTATDKEEFEEQ